MDLRSEVRGEIDILFLSGRLDLVSSSTLKDQIRQRLQDRRLQIVLSCHGLNFINSSGLGALISAQKDVRLSGGRISLCCLSPYVDELFALTGLKKVFEIHDTEDAALASFAQPLPIRIGTN